MPHLHCMTMTNTSASRRSDTSVSRSERRRLCVAQRRIPSRSSPDDHHARAAQAQRASSFINHARASSRAARSAAKSSIRQRFLRPRESSRTFANAEGNPRSVTAGHSGLTDSTGDQGWKTPALKKFLGARFLFICRGRERPSMARCTVLVRVLAHARTVSLLRGGRILSVPSRRYGQYLRIQRCRKSRVCPVRE